MCSEFNSLLCFDALFPKGVLDKGHFRDQISSLNQPIRSSSASEGNVGEFRPLIEALQDLIQFQIAKF